MKNKPATFIAAFALVCGIIFAGCCSVSVAQTSPAAPPPAVSGEQAQPAAEVLDVTVGALKEDPAAYDGKTLRIKGLYAGECADCVSFYLKDGLDTIETTVPQGFPRSVEIGSKLEIIGTPLLKNTARAGKPYVKLLAERATIVKE